MGVVWPGLVWHPQDSNNWVWRGPQTSSCVELAQFPGHSKSVLKIGTQAPPALMRRPASMRARLSCLLLAGLAVALRWAQAVRVLGESPALGAGWASALPPELQRRVLDLLRFRYQIASGTKDPYEVKLWGWGGARRTLVGHVGIILGIEFFPLGDRLLTWSRDGTARVWVGRIRGVEPDDLSHHVKCHRLWARLYWPM